MKDDKFSVALTNRLCPVCMEPKENEIRFNTKLTKKHAEAVKKMHGKNTGIMNEVCDDCRIDGVYLIGVIEAKTDDRSNPFRSGHIFGIKADAYERIFENSPPESGAAYVDIAILERIGLIDENGDIIEH